jgi:DNA repair exonuclease SbcCD nuclease subunit
MTKVRVLFIGDPHIRTGEMEYTDLMLKEIVDIARESGVDAIVDLGDTLHMHNKVDIDPLTRAINWLSELSDIAPLYVLIGNHDIRGPKVNLAKQEEKDRRHPFAALRKWKNVRVIDDVIVEEIGGMKFCFTPFLPESEYHETLKLKSVNPHEMKAFISHSNFYGVRYKLGDDPADCPDVWPEDYPLMIAGHNHEYQIVRDNLVYIGTPGQQDFGASPDKALAIIEFCDRQDGVDGLKTMKRIPLLTIPLRSIHVFKASDIESLNCLYNDLKASTRIRLVKIKLVGTKGELHILTKGDLYKSISDLKDVCISQEPTDTGMEKPIIEINSRPNASFDQIMLNVLHDNSKLLEMYKSL